jgi:hypothetical protein
MGKSSKGLIRVTSYMIVGDGMPDWDAHGHQEWPQYEWPQQGGAAPSPGGYTFAEAVRVAYWASRLLN